MKTEKITITPIKEKDINGLNTLPPPEWQLDYESFLRKYLNDNFYFPFLMSIDGIAVGSGNILLKDNIGWLANIFINSNYRGKGLGVKMTQHLIDFLHNKKCDSQLLIATEMGEHVYLKLGFKRTTTYQGYQSETDTTHIKDSNVRKLDLSDFQSVLLLDQEINGENREHFLREYYWSGFGYFDNEELCGFYLPDFGRGLVLARNQKAGLELLRIKHSVKGKVSYVPIENKVAIDFFERGNYDQLENFSRMFLDNDVEWTPINIYSYGSGYTG